MAADHALDHAGVAQVVEAARLAVALAGRVDQREVARRAGVGLGLRRQEALFQGDGDFLREADAIMIEEIKAANLYRQTSQAFAVLLPVNSVGVMGDARTYENAVALRCVNTDDFMTADWSHLPYELLARISTRIINEVKGVNRVCYDISSKPPATIEWE